MDKGLFSGPRLPTKLKNTAMVTSPDGKGVVVIGGEKTGTSLSSNSYHEMTGSFLYFLGWKTWRMKLKFPRKSHFAITIPQY